VAASPAPEEIIWAENAAPAKPEAPKASEPKASAPAVSAPKKAEVEKKAEVKEKPKAEEKPVELSKPAPQSDTDLIQGFGKDLPLVIALRQVVPPNYAYHFDEGVAPGQKVSWQGGKAWPQVLSDMLISNDLQAMIVGNVITVQKSGPPAAQKPAPAVNPDSVKATEKSSLPSAETLTRAPSDDRTEAQAAEAAERKAVSDKAPASAASSGKEKAPVVDTLSTKNWETKPGKTLRETLEDWSKIAGTEIEWMNPYDYPVEHSFAYQGRFDDAVDSLLALYAQETPRPRAKLYPNLPSGPSVLMIN
jgi:hypothetical protein